MNVPPPPVNELVQNDKVSWVNFLPQGAAGSGHQDVGAAACLQGPQVGSVVHIGGHDGVLAAVSTGTSGIGINFFFFMEKDKKLK